MNFNQLKRLVDKCVFSAEGVTIMKTEEYDYRLHQITQLTKQLKEFKEEHKIMKQILIENGLWERILNDDRFLKYLRDDNK